MQTVKRKTIMPFVDLTCITTDKFKTGFISVSLITPLSEKSAAKSALLPRVLCRGTETNPDITSISQTLEELYGARIEPVVRKIGEALCVGLCADFIDDDFVSKGENILENVISLICEMLLSPITRGGLLLSEYVESEKEKLIDDIKSMKSDKIRYALDRMLSTMCSGEAYGTPKLGSEASASAITTQSLTRHYRGLISSSKIEIIYCGAAASERVSQAFLYSLSTLPRRSSADFTGTNVVISPPAGKVRTVTDELEVAQGKLTLGFRIGNAMTSPNYPSMMVFNAIFGGTVTSKLFTNVREKMSLCYYANSMIEKVKGILIVYSGVEFKNFQIAFDEIMNQLDAIKKGEITDAELESARHSVASSILSRMDTPSGLESLYFDYAVSGLMMSPEEFAALAEAVTSDDVIKVASGVKLDTVHCLISKGGAGIEI